MARIRMLQAEEFDDDLRQMLKADRLSSRELGISRIMAHAPGVAKAHRQFGAALQACATLSPRLLELVRLRIAFHNQCRSCMSVRYRPAVDDGLTEELVCALERPEESPDLSAAERSALRYADLMATDHLAIDDAVYDELRRHFTEGQIVELGVRCATAIGFGRLAASWQMIDDLPERFKNLETERVTPWGEGAWISGRGAAPSQVKT